MVRGVRGGGGRNLRAAAGGSGSLFPPPPALLLLPARVQTVVRVLVPRGRAESCYWWKLQPSSSSSCASPPSCTGPDRGEGTGSSWMS